MHMTQTKKLPPEPLTTSEVYRLLDGCGQGHTGVRNRAMIILFWRGGPRCSELLALQRRDIDIDDQGMTVRIRHGKGNKARVIALDAESASYVRRWLEIWKAEYAGAKAFFCSVKKNPGRKLSTSAVRKWLARLRDKVALDKRVHAHGLRHTMARDLDDEGHPLRVIQGALGHANAATTSTYLTTLGGREVTGVLRRRQLPPKE